MTIGMVQSSPEKGALSQNLSKLDLLITGVPPGSFLFLPELFNTSYILHVDDLAREDSAATLNWMKRIAESGHFFIGGSIPVGRGDRMVNQWTGVDDSGLTYTYDKVHLFTPGGEGRAYVGGDEIHQFTIRDVVVRPLVCYDLRFPYISYQQPGRLYDMLVYAANWPSPRIEQWKQLLIARAIENQAYVVGVNRVGVDHFGNVYPGNSMVVDYTGKVVSEMDDQEGLALVNPDFEAMYRYREQLPFLKDMNPPGLSLKFGKCRDE